MRHVRASASVTVYPPGSMLCPGPALLADLPAACVQVVGDQRELLLVVGILGRGLEPGHAGPHARLDEDAHDRVDLEHVELSVRLGANHVDDGRRDAHGAGGRLRQALLLFGRDDRQHLAALGDVRLEPVGALAAVSPDHLSVEDLDPVVVQPELDELLQVIRVHEVAGGEDEVPQGLDIIELHDALAAVIAPGLEDDALPAGEPRLELAERHLVAEQERRRHVDAVLVQQEVRGGLVFASREGSPVVHDPYTRELQQPEDVVLEAVLLVRVHVVQHVELRQVEAILGVDAPVEAVALPHVEAVDDGVTPLLQAALEPRLDLVAAVILIHPEADDASGHGVTSARDGLKGLGGQEDTELTELLDERLGHRADARGVVREIHGRESKPLEQLLGAVVLAQSESREDGELIGELPHHGDGAVILPAHLPQRAPVQGARGRGVHADVPPVRVGIVLVEDLELVELGVIPDGHGLVREREHAEHEVPGVLVDEEALRHLIVFDVLSGVANDERTPEVDRAVGEQLVGAPVLLGGDLLVHVLERVVAHRLEADGERRTVRRFEP
ncbi:hypothetical protein STIAU_1663 [Stigmatella aurantiaca DW4/3-1]|uniref:Uncharacterized protein n=1 Tax=Stigmatella aurantiaca (strain DW4/3-1) TaxID=378806 RepID=Q095N9_STIAD|nr:hypothetical protein STIAU_1663 [Stigmatella aurantiaca DW4/3-1]